MKSLVDGDDPMTHQFDGQPCFLRCPQLGIYTMVKPGDAARAELVRISPSDDLVTCKLADGHEGPHEYPEIPGVELSERAER